MPGASLQQNFDHIPFPSILTLLWIILAAFDSTSIPYLQTLDGITDMPGTMKQGFLFGIGFYCLVLSHNHEDMMTYRR